MLCSFCVKKLFDMSSRCCRNILAIVLQIGEPMDTRVKRDQLDFTCFIISLFNAQHVSDVLTIIIKQVTSSWSLFTQL